MSAALLLLAGLGAEARMDHFTAVGLYIQPPQAAQQHYYEFLRAAGYNYLEFVDGGFGVRPDRLDAYYDDMAAQIATAQGHGFEVWMLLLAGMKQWPGPEPSGYAGSFSALDREQLEQRLSYLRRAAAGLSGADGLAFFAGDPGGDPEGRSTVDDCLAFAREVHRIARLYAPRTRFSLNLWAVAEWAGFPSPFGLEFWRKQVELSRHIAGDQTLLGSDCGLVFSLDGYYRSLTLACYAEAGLEPERFPTAADVAALRERGVSPLLGWPYFIVDEVDDGFITPNNVASGGQAQAETRYLRAIIDQGRALGLDGLVANASFIAAEALNIYVFGRMCRDAGLTPEAALAEYASILAESGADELTQVLRLIENQSNWQHSLPAEFRLPDLPCELDAAAALAALARVEPRAEPPIPLPEPPAVYLARLHRRLESIAAGELGGTAPIIPSRREGE